MQNLPKEESLVKMGEMVPSKFEEYLLQFNDVIESEIMLYQQGNQNDMDLYKSNENNMNLQILQRGSNMKLTILEY